jgi:hypothetical protein
MSQNVSQSKVTEFEYHHYDAGWRYSGLMTDVEKSIGQLQKTDILRNLALDFQCVARVLYEDNFLPLFDKLSDENVKVIKEHALIDKLQVEWEKVNQLIAASETGRTRLFFNEKYASAWIKKLVAAAAKDLGIDECEIVVLPDFGENYSLLSFNYSTDLVILEIPITALVTPWEWSVIWHEMAGYKAKKMKEKDGKVFSKILQESGVKTQDDIIESFEAFFGELRTKPSASNADMGILERVWNGFQQENASTAQISWTERNIQEMFEDACSVLAFGVNFLPIFFRILKRKNYFNDRKHPSPAARKELAQRLLGIHPESELIVSDKLVQLLNDLIHKELPLADKDYIPDSLTKQVREVILSAIDQYQSDPQRGDQIYLSTMDELNKIEFGLGEAVNAETPEARYKIIQERIEEKIDRRKTALGQCEQILDMKLSEVDEFVDVDHSKGDKSIYSLTIHGNSHYLLHIHQ